MFLKSFLLLAALAFAAHGDEAVSYSGHAVFKIEVTTKSQLAILDDLVLKHNAHFYSDNHVGSTEVMLNMNVASAQEFLDEALEAGFEVKLHVADVQQLIDQERETLAKIRGGKLAKGVKLAYDMDWDDYYPLETFYEYFDYLEGMLN